MFACCIAEVVPAQTVVITKHSWACSSKQVETVGGADRLLLLLNRLTCLAGGGGAGADLAAAPARPPADLVSARGATCDGARPSATSSRLRYLMSDSSMSPCTVSVVCRLACGAATQAVAMLAAGLTP